MNVFIKIAHMKYRTFHGENVFERYSDVTLQPSKVETSKTFKNEKRMLSKFVTPLCGLSKPLKHSYKSPHSWYPHNLSVDITPV